MLNVLKRDFRELERQRMHLMTELLALTPEQHQLRLKPGEWSVLEIVHHLVLTEREIGAPIWLEEPPVARQTLRSRILAGGVMIILRRRITVPVPLPAMIPASPPPLREIHQEWQSIRGALQSFLEHVAPERLSDAIFRHPVSGPFDTVMYLKLCHAHIASHHQQIQDIYRKHRI